MDNNGIADLYASIFSGTTGLIALVYHLTKTAVATTPPARKAASARSSTSGPVMQASGRQTARR